MSTDKDESEPKSEAKPVEADRVNVFFFQYFRKASTNLTQSTNVHEPASKKRKLQRDLSYCLTCNKTIAQGNLTSRQWHATSAHKNDPFYAMATAIVHADHQKAIAAMKEIEDEEIETERNRQREERRKIQKTKQEEIEKKTLLTHEKSANGRRTTQ